MYIFSSAALSVLEPPSWPIPICLYYSCLGVRYLEIYYDHWHFFQVDTVRFLTSNTALAIPWLLSLSILLAFLVPWLGTGGEFFFVSNFQKESRPQEVS